MKYLLWIQENTSISLLFVYHTESDLVRIWVKIKYQLDVVISFLKFLFQNYYGEKIYNFEVIMFSSISFDIDGSNHILYL